MLKTVLGPHGKKFKFGRKPSIARSPRLSLGNYLLRTFPTPPTAADYTPKAMAYLDNIYGNDICGDCTCAGIYHCKAVILANAGRPVPFSSADVTNLYKKLSGWNGVEDDPSDTGLDCQTVLNYAQDSGLPPDNDEIYGWVAIDGSNQAEVEAAIWLFGAVYFGVNLPDAWVADMNELENGDTWDVAGPGDPSNGHCFMGARYGVGGVTIDTWAMEILLTWPAVAKYATPGQGGEVFCIVDLDLINAATEKSPAGLNATQLLSDFQSIGAGSTA